MSYFQLWETSTSTTGDVRRTELVLFSFSNRSCFYWAHLIYDIIEIYLVKLCLDLVERSENMLHVRKHNFHCVSNMSCSIGFLLLQENVWVLLTSQKIFDFLSFFLEESWTVVQFWLILANKIQPKAMFSELHVKLPPKPFRSGKAIFC